MPLGFEDVTPASITGDPDPTRPMTAKEMQGAIKQRVNRTQLGPQAGGEQSANGSSEQKPQEQEQGGDQEHKTEPGQPAAPAQHGLQQGFQALQDGVGQILKDPAWMQHPLLRLFSDPTGDPNQVGQDLWATTQWWGRTVNAAIDVNAIHQSAINIEHDNSVGAQILKTMTPGVFDPHIEFAWNVMPYVLAMASEWEPWMWGPALAAQGPPELSQLPGAVMGLLGDDLHHPKLQDPQWYARMGSYVLAALVASKAGGEGSKAMLQFTRTMPGLDRFAEFADRMLGGPGKKTPIKGPDGQIYDPDQDPTGHAYAAWYNTFIKPVEEAETTIGKGARKAETALISHPDIEGAYQEVPRDPTAKADFARLLGLPINATGGEVADKFFALVEDREISPGVSAKVVANWDRFGPVIGQMGHIRYWHAGEAPYRNVIDSMKRITDPKLAEHASKAMRAANGIRADLWKGIHGYGNDLTESLVKGILSHGRSGDYYQGRLGQSLRAMFPRAAERERIQRAIEEPNLHAHDPDWTPEQGLYGQLDPHEQWAVDLYRRLSAEVRSAKLFYGVQLEGMPNYFARVPKRLENLEKVLKGLGPAIRAEANTAAMRTPFGYIARQHRAIQLQESPQGELRAETAYPTTQDTNAQRVQWRQQIKDDLKVRAVAEPALKAIVNDPQKLEALAYAEIPDYSTDFIDSLFGLGNRGIFPDMRALFTHQVMETAKRTLVLNDVDGRWHPLAVARDDKGQESSPTLSQHFKDLHGEDTVRDYYSGQGWKAIDGFGAGNIFHSSLADPLNTAIRFAQGDGGKALRFIKKLSGVGKKFIMLNPAWHSTNMMGRFAWLAESHPSMVNRLLKARGLKELTAEQAQEWWDYQEHEMIEHGGLPPQLNTDVVSDAGRYHMFATGDTETGTPLDVKQPVKGFLPGPGDALNAVKGADAWWQNHVNGLMWRKIHDFEVLAYISLKDDAIRRGMMPGDARLMAASQANAWAGMVSPDRWANSPFMYGLSQVALFAPNWWRTYPRLILNSYDRMGMKSNPALTHAWALNTAKTIGSMILLKGATDNMLNWLMSGHWQFQNPDGYKNQVTMDRWAPVNPKTGAHTVMEDPFTRQPGDLEKALGILEAMKYGHWEPQFAEEGTAEVLAARVSPFVDSLEMASNLDMYQTLKQRALRWVDPSHPYPVGGPGNWLAALTAYTPWAFAVQAGVQGVTAQPQQLTWGPFAPGGPWAGTTVPGWVARGINPNEPLSSLMGLLGTRGGYPAPIRSPERGLSSAEQIELVKINNDYNSWLQTQQTAAQTGGQTWAEFAYQYRLKSAAHANEIQGKVGGTSEYMQGAEGVLSKYESLFNDKQSFDANGDINWAYVQRAQNQLQAKTDPATWRQMESLRDKRELQYPILHVYKDSLRNYHNWQDTEARALGMDGETLRSLIAQGAQSPNFKQFEAKNPKLSQYYAAKRKWETTTKQGFAYGLFSNNTYVMRIVAPTGDIKQAERAEQQILPQIEEMEKAGQFVTQSGQ